MLTDDEKDNLQSIKALIEAIDQRLLQSAISGRFTAGTKAEIKTRCRYIIERL